MTKNTNQKEAKKSKCPSTLNKMGIEKQQTLLKEKCCGLAMLGRVVLGVEKLKVQKKRV